MPVPYLGTSWDEWSQWRNRLPPNGEVVARGRRLVDSFGGDSKPAKAWVAHRYCMDFASRRFYHALGRRERLGLGPMTHHGQIRWYNPTLEDFEWRALPTTDEQALSLLEGSPYSATCTQTYRQWRQLGAAIGAALMRAGEAAKQQSENEKREDDAS